MLESDLVSNNSVYVVVLGKDPEDASAYIGRPARKLRLVDKGQGKNSIDRWFDATVTGPDVDVCDRLRSGNQIVIAGALQLTEFTYTKGAKKGTKQREDRMPYAKIIQVTRSETFFTPKDETTETAEAIPETQPEATPSPLDGL